MDLKIFGVIIALVIFLLAGRGRHTRVEKREWLEDPSPGITEGDVECFSEYMELWVHKMKIEGLRLWLSRALRIPVSLVSLDHLNLKLSACGFSLHRDPDRNYIFRVLYSGCFVQLQQGHHVMSLNLLKMTSRFGGRSKSFVMRCPLATAPPSGEYVQCDPEFIEVTRQIPTDNWNNKLPWSLALRGKLVVALEDASLIRLNVETQGSNITVQGRRREILTADTEMDHVKEFLALRLVSGHYSYSMEAVCPSVSSLAGDEAVLYILKRRMGLVKRGWSESESLTLSGVSVNQTDAFTVFEGTDYVQLTVNTSLITRSRSCPGPVGGRLVQPFFRVDAVVTFKETPHRLFWSMESYLPCRESTSLSPVLVEMKGDQVSVTDLHTATPSSGSTPAVASTNWMSVSHEQLIAGPNAHLASTTAVPPLSERVPRVTSPAGTSDNLLNVNMVTPATFWNMTHVTSVINGVPSPVPPADARTLDPTEVSNAFPKLDPKPLLSDLTSFLVREPPTTTGPTQAAQRERTPYTMPAIGSGSGVTVGCSVTPAETPGSLLSLRGESSELKERDDQSSGSPTGLGQVNRFMVIKGDSQDSGPTFTPDSVSELDSSTMENQLPDRGLAIVTTTIESAGLTLPKADPTTTSSISPSSPASPSADHGQLPAEAVTRRFTPSVVPLSSPSSDRFAARPNRLSAGPILGSFSWKDSIMKGGGPQSQRVQETDVMLDIPPSSDSQPNGSVVYPISPSWGSTKLGQVPADTPPPSSTQSPHTFPPL